jgi:L-amino acid N-acyltransferase YncA
MFLYRGHRGDFLMFQIRDAHESDLPRLLDIYNHAVLHSTATFDVTPLTLEERMEWLRHHNERYPLIVADKNDEVIGYSCLSPFRNKPAYRKTAELSVYIDYRHRGGGVGRALVEEILQRARSLGYHSIISAITAGNKASVRLHERMGFTFVGRLKEVGYKFGEWQDVLYYQLLITDGFDCKADAQG